MTKNCHKKMIQKILIINAQKLFQKRVGKLLAFYQVKSRYKKPSQENTAPAAADVNRESRVTQWVKGIYGPKK
jgi:hypothetical protein